MTTAQRAWWQSPNRVLLINLREGDEPRIDPDRLIEEVKAFSATAFCINGGGIVAFYQTRIADHPKSAGLNGRDLLAELVPRAHAQGIHVLARIDPSCAPRALAEEHPDWFARDRAGGFYPVNEFYVTCPNAGYYRDRMAEVVREMLTQYDVDGIWNNQGKFAAWDTDGCFCDTCKTLFKKDSGFDLPLTENWDDPAWRAFNEWRYRRIAAWVAHMHAEIHRAKPAAIFIAAVQLMESLETIRPGGWDIDYWLEHQDVPTFECQRRNTAPWWPGIQAKYLSSIAPDTQRWMTVSYFYPWWRLYATPEAENRAWIAQQFANGVNSWLHINGGYSELFDRRSLAPMREVFARLARWEPYFDGAQSGARVALVFSRHTQDNYAGADTHGKYFDAVRGFYCALLEAHIPFDVISDKFIDTARLARYRVLVLPNVACVDDAGAAAIEAFVAAGGAAVATFDTGMRTRDGGARAEPAFAKMFGVTVRGRRSDLKSSYARIDDAQDPLVAGIGDTDLIPNEGALVEVTAAPGRSVPLTLIPPVIAHSGATISIPEYSAIRATTDVPVAVHGTHGKGRTVYFANPMDALFYRYGFPDLGRVLANAVRHTLADAHNLEVDAPEFVDIALNVQPRRKLVHLINFPVAKQLSTGWRHAGRTLVPLRDIPVRVKLVAGERVRETRVASSEMVIACVQDGEWACVMVPALDDHEIIIFELA
jgi:Hypothetical glycosyl hydrolase 6/Beta-galactosidase trimerisation domain